MNRRLVLRRHTRGVATFALVFATLLATQGAIVRATGSGLGCPDWPLCHGSITPPPDDIKAIIEYTHRVLAGIGGLLILTAAVLVLRSRGGAWVFRGSAIALIILLSIFLILGDIESPSFELIKKNSPLLIDKNYLPNYTAGLTFFIAVAATNLFHQGNWQRVFSAKNNSILRNSLIYSSFLIFFIVFWMGYSGLIAYSLNPDVIPDLGFFDLLLKDKNSFIVIGVLVLALSLTLSTIDTLINAISSLIIVNGDQINKSLKGKEIKKKQIK